MGNRNPRLQALFEEGRRRLCKKERTSLAKALKERGNGRKGRRADLGVFETSCLKICPKNAVVAINAARPKGWLIVPRGTDLDEVAERLGVGAP